MSKTATIVAIFFVLCFATQSAGNDSLVDPRDGKKYELVQIGKQVWMKDNLNYKIDSSWCYGNKNINCDKYGRLYKWDKAREVCPGGWHLPKRAEWFDLFKVIEGESSEPYCACGYSTTKAEHERWQREKFAGKKLKSKTDWNGTDDFGFSALPGGMRYFRGGTFRSLGHFGYYWSDHKFNSELAYFWAMRTGTESVEDLMDYKTNGFSIRCVRDEPVPDEQVRESERPKEQKQETKKCNCHTERTTAAAPVSKVKDIDMNNSDDSRSKEEIMAVANVRMPGLRNTYKKYLKLRPGFSGNITLKLIIAPSGDVIDIYKISSTTDYADFDNAIEDMIYTWKWKILKTGKSSPIVTFSFRE